MFPGMDQRIPVPVASVILREGQPKVGNGDSQLAPLEVISFLVTRPLRTAQEGRLADGIVFSRAGGWRHGKRTLNEGVGEGVFVIRTPRAWGEPVFAGGHFFFVFVSGMVGGCPGWPISGGTDW